MKLYINNSIHGPIHEEVRKFFKYIIFEEIEGIEVLGGLSFNVYLKDGKILKFGLMSVTT